MSVRVVQTPKTEINEEWQTFERVLSHNVEQGYEIVYCTDKFILLKKGN